MKRGAKKPAKRKPKKAPGKSRSKRAKPSKKRAPKKVPVLLTPMALISAFLVLFVLVLSAMIPLRTSPTGRLITEIPKMEIKIFTTPLDPHSAHIENLMIELSQRFRNRLDMEFGYLKDDDEALFRVCAQKYNPDMFFHYAYCINRNLTYAAEARDTCAQNYLTKHDKIVRCYQSTESQRLQDSSRNRMEKAGITVSPTIIIDNERYTGDKSESGLTRAICSRLYNPPPICGVIPNCYSDFDCGIREGMAAVCKNPGTSASNCVYSKLESVTVIILESSECIDCSTDRVLKILRTEFGKVDVVRIDSDSQEGILLVQNHRIRFLPAYLLPISVQSHARFDIVKNSLRVSEDYYILSDDAGKSNFPVS